MNGTERERQRERARKKKNLEKLFLLKFPFKVVSERKTMSLKRLNILDHKNNRSVTCVRFQIVVKSKQMKIRFVLKK